MSDGGFRTRRTRDTARTVGTIGVRYVPSICFYCSPTRNRIIAGLSDVRLVVESGLKGGALITARIALDYGVPVSAVPGDVDRIASVGTNLLIRDGAFPILGPEDLTEVLILLEPSYTSRNDTVGEATYCAA